jgi:hypothetical protein
MNFPKSTPECTKCFNQLYDLLFKNKVVNSVIGLLLILYITLAAPRLPQAVIKLMDNIYFKFVYILLMAYVASESPSVAIISAVALMITLQTLSNNDMVNKIMSFANNAKKLDFFANLAPTSIDVSKINLPLSPNKLDFINSCNKIANYHLDQAKKADAIGDTNVATMHTEAAVKENVKADAVIKAEVHKQAAEQAKVDGNLAKADAHITEVIKQQVKVDSLVKSDQAKQAAVEATLQGKHEQAQTLNKVADAEENKVKMLIKAETKLEQAAVAHQEGRVNDALKKETVAKKLEDKVLNMYKNEAAQKQVVTTYSVSASETESDKTSTNDISGFIGNDFASF